MQQIHIYVGKATPSKKLRNAVADAHSSVTGHAEGAQFAEDSLTPGKRRKSLVPVCIRSAQVIGTHVQVLIEAMFLSTVPVFENPMSVFP